MLILKTVKNAFNYSKIKELSESIIFSLTAILIC